MCSPWLITRPNPEAETDAAALMARGVPAQAFPALKRTPLPWDGDHRGADLLLLTSASTVDPVAAAFATWTTRPAVFALGPATAARARALGLSVEMEVPGGVSALVHAVIEALGRRMIRRALLPTSDRGLEAPEQRDALARLRSRVPVETVPVISVQPHPDLPARLAALPSPARWVFASPSAVQAVFSAGPPPTALAVICHGASTRSAWHLAPAGWPEPLPAVGATVVERVLSTTQG